MDRSKLLPALLVLLIGAAASTVRAQDDDVHEPAPPVRAAFLRLFNATPQPLENVRFGPESLGDIAAYEASGFVDVPPGPYTLTVNGKRQQVQLAANRYYTAVLRPDGLKLLDSERYRNRMKALVILYNLIDGGELSLRTDDGRTTVVENVPPNRFGTREVNAVRTTLALYRGDQRLAQVRSVILERGRAFSLFVAGTQDQPVPVWVVN